LIIIRDALSKDLIDITDIYNEAILNTVATFDTNIKTLDQQKKWFDKHGLKNPIIVAEDNEKVVGWASLSKYSDKCAYSDTAELSLYVKEEFQRKGIGKRMMKEIVKRGKKAGLHAIISRIAEGNQVSVNLHKMVGFEYVGIYKEVGFKFERRLDVYLMEKLYKK
jgi:phosphinothricin acetyltransferase